jgi:hypothetical protein
VRAIEADGQDVARVAHLPEQIHGRIGTDLVFIGLDVEQRVRARSRLDGDDGDAAVLGHLELRVRLDRLAHGDDDRIDLLGDERLELLGVFGQRTFRIEQRDAPALRLRRRRRGIGHARVRLGRKLESDHADLDRLCGCRARQQHRRRRDHRF